MRWNLIGAFIRNKLYGTEVAFRKGLERIGEHVTAIDPGYPDQKFDEAADVTIVFKNLEAGAYLECLKNQGGIKVVYQPDDLRIGYIRDMMKDMRQYCDHAWLFSDSAKNLIEDLKFKTVSRLLVSADNTLYRYIPGTQKDIDVCFIGNMSGEAIHNSRRYMCEMVSKMPKIRFASLFAMYDLGKLVEVYNRSKIILNHSTDFGQAFGHGYGYQCRHFEAGMTKSLLLSNKVDDETGLNNFLRFGSVKDLNEMINTWVHSDALREFHAQEFYNEIYNAHLPEHRAIEMIRLVEAIWELN